MHTVSMYAVWLTVLSNMLFGSNCMPRSPVAPYLACTLPSEGCWELIWLPAPAEDLKAMGQLGHLWNTSQWATWMCVLMEFRPPNTMRQLEHLQGGAEGK